MCTNNERRDHKMIPSSRETNFPTKDQESENKKVRASSSTSNATTTPTLLTPWLKSKDPRIVRVSRAFGGKDRHSKVCTVRGLRDRRVRLSVPTAIQLYDLQDRLGLNQPSKVVDWLLNVAKDDIDELPPLQGSFIPDNQGVVNWEYFSNSNTSTRSESKDVETNDEDDEKEDQGINNTTPSTNYGTVPYYHLDPSHFNFSQQDTNHHHNQEAFHQNLNVFPFHSPLSSLPSRSTAHHHGLVHPQGTTTTQAYFPSYIPSNAAAADFDHSRQNNHLHMLNSSSQNLTSPSFSLGESMRSFQLSITPMHIDGKSSDHAGHPK